MKEIKTHIKEMEGNLCLYIEETDAMYDVWIGMENYGIRNFAIGVYKKDCSLEDICSWDYSIEIKLFMEMCDKLESET